MATMQESPPRSGVKAEVGRFWKRVSEGLEVGQLWSQFSKDARSGYRFYAAGLGGQTQGTSGVRRAWMMTRALFWAILEKLSPARRVLLLLALVLLLLPVGGFTYGDEAGEIRVIQFDMRLWGGLLLLLVLLLELADRVIMKRDLEIARDIQSWLLPDAPLPLPGYAIAHTTRPANTVAGDYYDVVLRPGETRDHDRVLVVVADVAGKSLPAALLMATFQASLRTLSSSGASLAAIVGGLNDYTCTNSQGGARFTTAFVAELEPTTGRLIYINAGHNAPLLRKTSGPTERLDTGGPPLGISRAFTHQAGSARLTPGDWLVVFTDGVVEAVNAAGEEYGEGRLVHVVDDAAAGTPPELLRCLLADLDTFVGDTPQHDDVTCLLLKRA